MDDDRKSFITDMFPYSNNIEYIKESEREVEQILPQLGISAPKQVLDLSCNYGMHAITLAQKGFKVTICDYLTEVENLTSNSAEAQNVNVTHQNIFDLKEKNKYHAIFDLDYNFGILKEKSQNKELVVKLFGYLAPGGKLVMRLIGRDVLEKYFHPKFWVQHDDGSYLLNHRHINYDTGWLEERYVFIKKDEIKKYTCGMFLYYPHEIVELLGSSGFKNIKISGHTDGRPYDDRAQNLFVIGEKPSFEINQFIKC